MHPKHSIMKKTLECCKQRRVRERKKSEYSWKMIFNFNKKKKRKKFMFHLKIYQWGTLSSLSSSDVRGAFVGCWNEYLLESTRKRRRTTLIYKHVACVFFNVVSSVWKIILLSALISFVIFYDLNSDGASGGSIFRFSLWTLLTLYCFT